jgi:hypothetical protein
MPAPIPKRPATKTLVSLWIAAFGLLAMQPALACLEKDHGWTTPSYFIAFAVVIALVSTLVLLAWGIKKIFFPNQNILALLHVATGFMGIVLGMMGSFAAPQFQTVYASFGTDPPAPTTAVLALGHFLWVPALLIIFLWLASQNSSKKAHYLVIALVAQTLFLLWVLWALYLPIFN